MQRLLTGYVVSFNRRYRRHGPLFQNRFKSIVCQEERYLNELVRYGLTELASHLGITQPAVGYAVKRGEHIAKQNGYRLLE